jgi:hypothetical protein
VRKQCDMCKIIFAQYMCHTSIYGKSLPYVSGAIERDSGGDVTAVRLVDGVGMLISADENIPFPCND